MSVSKRSELEDTTSSRIEALIDEHELARIIGRSVASVRRDRLLGKGCPYVKLSALVRYRPADVRAYIENNLRGTQNKAGGR